VSTIIPRYTDRLVNTSDFWLEVQRGSFDDMSTVLKFGKNDAVANGTWEMIANLSDVYPWPQAATTIRVKAGGDATDVAVTGSGARTVRVEGLDENLAFTTEDIALAGASASAPTTTTFFRVFRAYVLTTGTYGGKNTAAVTFENTAGTSDLLLISAGESQTQLCSYTIPAGKSGQLLGFEFHIDGGKSADTRMCFRTDVTNVSGDMSPTRVAFLEFGVDGGSQNQPTSTFGSFPAGTDIWLEAKGNGAGTRAVGAMEILLIDDEATTVKAVS